MVVQIGERDGSGNQIVPQITAGTNGSIPVFMYTTGVADDSGFTMTGYDLAFDFGMDGKGFLPVFSNFNGNFNPAYSGTSGVSLVSSGINFDLGASASGSVILDSFDSPQIAGEPSTAFKLFDLTFDVSALAVPGTYNVSLEEPGLFPDPFGGPDVNYNVLAGTNIPVPSGLAPLGGQFQVTPTAVPEPGSMLALAGVFALGGARQWRKRKRCPVASPAV